jgi:hypothetical protein
VRGVGVRSSEFGVWSSEFTPSYPIPAERRTVNGERILAEHEHDDEDDWFRPLGTPNPKPQTLLRLVAAECKNDALSSRA